MTMPEFDPYLLWLGIPRREQPPHHYRLLDVPIFETDVVMIETGFNRRMAYLRDVKGGNHLDAAEKLKDELADARHCLLHVDKKAAYDRQLKASLEAIDPSRQAPPALTPPVPAPPAPTPPVSKPPAWATSVVAAPQLRPLPELASWPASTVMVPAGRKKEADRRRRRWVGFGLLLLLGGLGLGMLFVSMLPWLRAPSGASAAMALAGQQEAQDLSSGSPPSEAQRQRAKPLSKQASVPPVQILANAARLDESWPDEYDDWDYPLPLSAEQADTLGTATKPLRATSLAIDEKNRQLYTAFLTAIHRSSLDGNGQELVLDGLHEPSHLGLDASRQMLYWIGGNVPHGPRVVQSATVDGGQFEPHAAFLKGDQLPAVDGDHRRLLRFERRSLGHEVGVPHLLMSDFNGKKEDVLYADCPDGRAGSPGRVMGDSLYYTDGRKSGVGYTTVFRARLDGGGTTTLGHYFYADPFLGLALDNEGGLYVTTANGIDRLDLQRQVAQPVVAIPGGAQDVAYDAVERKLYWIESERYQNRVQCIRLPAPRRKHYEAPPLITSFSPEHAAPGDKIQVRGRFLAKTSEVRFLDDATGGSVAAQFVAAADDALEVVQPLMSPQCSHPLIVLAAPGGVTVSLPANVEVMEAIKPWQRQQKVNRIDREPGFAVLLMNSVHVSDFQHQAAYVTQGCSTFSSPVGENTFFVKNGASCGNLGSGPSRIYLEPYASTTSRPQRDAEDILIRVPAIRASIVPNPLGYLQPKADPQLSAVKAVGILSGEEGLRQQLTQHEAWPDVYHPRQVAVPVDASQAEVVLDVSPGRLTSFAIDGAAQKIFWLGKSRRGAGGADPMQLYSTPFNGAAPRVLVAGLPDSHNLTLSRREERLFWIARGRSNFILQSAPANGGPPQTLGSPIELGTTAAVDPEAGKIYRFVRQGNWGEIVESNLDDSQPRRLYSTRPELAHLVPVARIAAANLYFLSISGENRSTVYRAALDGSTFTKLGEIPAPWFGYAVTIDPVRKCLYCAEWVGRRPRGQTGAGIQRFDWEFGQVDQVFSGVGAVEDLALDETGQQLYWASFSGQVRRAPLPPLRGKQNVVAPPLLVDVAAEPAVRGRDVTLTGRYLAHVLHVWFIDDSDGRAVSANFTIASDESLLATVPAMSVQCKRPLVVVLSESGVTVTLPPETITRRVAARDDGEFHAGQLSGEGFVFSLFENAHARDFSGKTFYLNRGSGATLNTSNAVFVKNGATYELSKQGGNHVFVEPCADVVGQSDAVNPDRVVHVQAIRGSVVPKLPRYEDNVPPNPNP